jgi:hypothetical protein
MMGLWMRGGLVGIYWKQLRGDGRSAALMVLYRFGSVELDRKGSSLTR